MNSEVILRPGDRILAVGNDEVASLYPVPGGEGEGPLFDPLRCLLHGGNHRWEVSAPRGTTGLGLADLFDTAFRSAPPSEFYLTKTFAGFLFCRLLRVRRLLDGRGRVSHGSGAMAESPRVSQPAGQVICASHSGHAAFVSLPFQMAGGADIQPTSKGARSAWMAPSSLPSVHAQDGYPTTSSPGTRR